MRTEIEACVGRKPRGIVASGGMSADEEVHDWRISRMVMKKALTNTFIHHTSKNQA